MIARRKKKAPPIPDWEVATEITLHRRSVTPGTELSIEGWRGRYRFIKQVTRPQRGVVWLDVADAEGQIRSVHPDRVKRVHRVGTTPKSLLLARQKLGYEK